MKSSSPDPCRIAPWTPEALKALGRAGQVLHVRESIPEAWKLAKSLAQKEDLVLAAGSIYFVGELLTIEGQTRPELIP